MGKNCLYYNLFYFTSSPSDWGHLLIDIKRLPNWLARIEDHASERHALKKISIISIAGDNLNIAKGI